MTTTTLASPPWYKQFWPWFLIFFPATAVIAGIVTIIIAIKSDDGLVKDDYYKAGLAINQTLERKQKAESLNMSADVSWDKLTQSITMKLEGNLNILPARVNLILAHPTRSKQDQHIPLFLSPDKKFYTGRTKTIINGNWIIILEPQLESQTTSWRLQGSAKLPEQINWHMN